MSATKDYLLDLLESQADEALDAAREQETERRERAYRAAMTKNMKQDESVDMTEPELRTHAMAMA